MLLDEVDRTSKTVKDLDNWFKSAKENIDNIIQNLGEVWRNKIHHFINPNPKKGNRFNGMSLKEISEKTETIEERIISIKSSQGFKKVLQIISLANCIEDLRARSLWLGNSYWAKYRFIFMIRKTQPDLTEKEATAIWNAVTKQKSKLKTTNLKKEEKAKYLKFLQDVFEGKVKIPANIWELY